MNDAANDDAQSDCVDFECELEAPPEKVWRAIAIPAFRQQWLPEADLAEPEPIGAIPGVEVRYRMRDEGEPPLRSTVTFRIAPGDAGGTVFRVIHRVEGMGRAASANDNTPSLMLAA